MIAMLASSSRAMAIREHLRKTRTHFNLPGADLAAGKDSRIRSGAVLVLMSLVLLFSFAVGANGLYTEPIWTDELYSLSNMGVFGSPYSPQEIIQSITTYSPDHVPFYYLLGAAWAQFAGWSQVSMRMIAVLCAVLAVAWIYQLGKTIFDLRTGLVAALLMTTSAYVILFFHDIRMYTLLLMLAAMHTWLYWRLAHRRRTTRMTWLLFLITTVVLLYTHIFALLVLAQLGIFHLLFAKRSRRWRQILYAWAIGALTFLPYLNTLYTAVQLAMDNENVTERAASIPELASTLFYLLANGNGILALSLVGAVAWVLGRWRDPSATRLAAVALATMALIMLVNEFVGIVPISRMRYFLILWIPFVLLCAYAVTSMDRWRTITVLFIVAWGLSGFHFYRTRELMDYMGGMYHARNHPPLHQYVDALRGKVREHDYLLGFSFLNYINTDFKFGESIIDYYLKAQLGIDGAFIPKRWRDERLNTDIVRKIDRHPFLLFAYRPLSLPPNFADVSAYVRSNYDFCSEIDDTRTFSVERYVHPLAGCEHEYRPVHYDNGIKIVDHFGAYDPDSDRVQVVTGWEVADEGQLDKYNISFQILTGDWQKMSQIDEHLYHDILKWHELEMSTAQLPPGNYRLVVILYDRYSGEKVSGNDQTSGEYGSILPLLNFSVEN